MRSLHSPLLALAIITSSAAAQSATGTRQAPADLIVVGARIYTVDSLHPTAEALAVRGGRIEAVGSEAEVRGLAGKKTTIVDAHGRFVIPGMTDAHGHLRGLGESLRQVDLVGVTSYDEVIRRVAARAKTTPKGRWVFGHGWDQNRWAGARFPTHDALTAAVADHPVMLERIDGHAVLANAAAMRAAGVTAATPDPAGGRIERDASGAPTGVFVDNAKGLVERAVPDLTPDELRDVVLAAVAETNRWGLTGVHDAGVSARTFRTYETLARAGRFTLRDYAMASDDSLFLDSLFRRGPRAALYDGHLWLRAVKLYADGALGSRGAALLAPYSDDSTNTGLLVSTPAHIEAVAERALRAGFQVNVHAIGDRGNRVVLDAFDSALAKAPKGDYRFRIEHAQVLSPADIPRFARLGVIPSMQASHQTSDMGWAERRLGPERIKGAYAWRSLLSTGVVVPNGSDFPVEYVNPLISFHSAVTRQNADNQPAGGWYPSQKMTREEALRAMTIWAAYAGFQEKELGSLTPGKYADFVILDQDIMTVPDEQILTTRVIATYLGGKRIYAVPAR